MSLHRGARVRPRYGRIAAATAAVVVTLTAVLGGMGVLPQGRSSAVSLAPSLAPAAAWDVTYSLTGSSPSGKQMTEPPVVAADPRLVPAESGEGKRVVFSQTDQRVWLIDRADKVQRSYLVSGSVYDNLEPGTYSVFSRSEQAWGIDDSGTMRWFVRFAHGDNAAIGFHDIPVADGNKIQGAKELGTPQSHGCIRQRTSDALALWDFAPLGTTVVVI